MLLKYTGIHTVYSNTKPPIIIKFTYNTVIGKPLIRFDQGMVYGKEGWKLHAYKKKFFFRYTNL